MTARVGVIGLGRIGSRYDQGKVGKVPRSHVGAILGSRQCKLVGVCDLAEEGLRTFRADWGDQAPGYRSVASFLTGCSPDVAVLATPAETHARLIRQLIAHPARPRLVFCEKPFGRDFREARALAQLCARAGVLVVVNFHRRWDRRFAALAARCARLGPPESVIVTYRKGLLNYGSHLVDVLMQLFGPIASVCGERQEPSSHGLSDPSLSAQLKFASGAVARMIGVDGVAYELLDFELYFKSFRYRLNLGGYTVEEFRPSRGGHYVGYVTLPERGKVLANGPVSGLREAYRELPRILAGRSKVPYATAASAVDVHRVLEAIRKSSRSGKRVRV